jgi:hypothetical protein
MEQPKDKIARYLNLLIGITVILYVAVGIMALFGVKSYASLCTIKSDYQERVKQSQVFLKEHPNGIPGIDKGSILVSLANQKRTAKSLDGLWCP